MTPSTTPPPPHGALASARRHWRGILDLALVAVLAVVAGQARLAWVDLGISVDWTWFVESSNSLAQGRAHQYVQYLYTSVPCVIFAGFIEVLHDPMRLMKAWALLGALCAPLTYLAVRRVAGPVGGMAAGWILAVHYDNVVTVTGIKSPYAIATWTALAALGLAASTQRRPWGPPLFVLGAALAIGHHLGLWLLTPAVVVLACLHIARLRGRQRWLSAGLSLALGAAVLGIVLAFDLTRLLEEIPDYRARFGSPQGSMASGAATFMGLLLGRVPALHGERLLSGLASTTTSLRLLGGVAAAGIVVTAGRLAWLWRRRRAGAEPLPAQRPVLEASAVGLQALLLLGLGACLYLANMVGNDYFENHHVVALVPILALAMGGLARGLASARLGAWGALIPSIALAGWLWQIMPHLMPLPAPAISPAQFEVHSFRNAAEVAVAIRDDARAMGRQPGLLLWTRRPDQVTPWLLPDLANELARLDWRGDDLPPACYVVHQRGLDARLGAGRAIPLSHVTGLSLRAFDDCSQLAPLEGILCGGLDRSSLWRGQQWTGKADATAFLDQVLPCVRTR